MFAGLRATCRAALGLLLVGSLPSLVLATSWGPRADVGVAALDIRTGKVLWEAWQFVDVPEGASKEAKATVKTLLAQPERYYEWDRSVPSFPAALGKDRVADYVYEDSKHHLILAHGSPRAVGVEIARFSFDADDQWQYALAGGSFYLYFHGHAYAFPGHENNEPADKRWKASWAFDLLAQLAEQERKLAKYTPTL